MGRDKPYTVPPVPRLGSSEEQALTFRLSNLAVGHSYGRWVLSMTWMKGFCQGYLNHEPGSPGMQSKVLASPCSTAFRHTAVGLLL